MRHFADMLQIGARNMQNFTLLRAASRSGKPVLLKRGAGATIEEWLMAAEYILAEGNPNVVLCERGIRTFERATRHTLDLNAVVMVQERTHLPVIVDPSHAAGVRSLVIPLSLGSLAAGADGLIVEVHPDPSKAMSDGAQSLDLAGFGSWPAEYIRGGRPERGWWRSRSGKGRRAEGVLDWDSVEHPLSLFPFATGQGTVVRRPTNSRYNSNSSIAPMIEAMMPGPCARIRVPAQRSSNETGQQRTGDAQQHRDDEAARVLPGHQQLRDRPDDQTNDQGPEKSHSPLRGGPKIYQAPNRTSVSGRTPGEQARSRVPPAGRSPFPACGCAECPA